MPANGSVDGSAAVARHLRCVKARPAVWRALDRLTCSRDRRRDMAHQYQIGIYHQHITFLYCLCLCVVLQSPSVLQYHNLFTSARLPDLGGKVVYSSTQGTQDIFWTVQIIIIASHCCIMFTGIVETIGSMSPLAPSPHNVALTFGQPSRSSSSSMNQPVAAEAPR